MAYAVYGDIEYEFKNITFGATGNITSAKVTEFITQIEALINSYVGQRYETPVTAGTSAVALLKLFTVSLVADRVRAIMEVKQTTSTEGNQSVRGTLLSVAEVMKQLKAIRDDEINLDGATLLVANSGFYSRNNANDESPVFKKDCKDW